MSNGGVCRTAPATPGLLNIMENLLETYILSLGDVANHNTVAKEVKRRQYIIKKKLEEIGLPTITVPLHCSSQMLSMKNYNLTVICNLL